MLKDRLIAVLGTRAADQDHSRKRTAALRYRQRSRQRNPRRLVAILQLFGLVWKRRFGGLRPADLVTLSVFFSVSGSFTPLWVNVPTASSLFGIELAFVRHIDGFHRECELCLVERDRIELELLRPLIGALELAQQLAFLGFLNRARQAEGRSRSPMASFPSQICSLPMSFGSGVALSFFTNVSGNDAPRWVHVPVASVPAAFTFLRTWLRNL